MDSINVRMILSKKPGRKPMLIKHTAERSRTMAMYDWNHNGKKDMGDNFIEYQIYKDVTGEKKESSYTPGTSNGMSTFGAVVSIIAGLFIQCALYVTLGIDVENVPVLVIIILWVVISVIVAVIVDIIGL